MSRELGLRPQEQRFFDSLFYSCEGSRTVGLVNGSAIKGLFTQSRLPKSSLSTIWTLSDRQQRRLLDIEDFYLACRLIAIAQQNLPITLQSVRAYPDIPLPQFEGNALQVSAPIGMNMPPQQQPGAAPQKHVAPMTSAGGSLGSGPLLGLPQHGQSSAFPAPLNRAGSLSSPASAIPAASPSAAVADEWTMTDTERTQYVSLFSQADADGDGFVGGPEAKRFFKQSGLDNATLKQIWLLSDVDLDNRLNPDEFLIAMHLTLRVRKNLPLPSVLPASMDPRMKQQQGAPQHEIDGKTGKAKLNMDLLPDLLPQVQQQQPQVDLLGGVGSGFDVGAPGGAAHSKPASRRASASSIDFAGSSAASFGVGGGMMMPGQNAPNLAGGYGAPMPLQQPTPSGPTAGFGFNQAAASPQQQQQAHVQQPYQPYHLIEATQAVEDRTTQLQTLSNQTDATKRSIGQSEHRLEAKLKEVEELTLQVQAQEQQLSEQRAMLQSVEDQFHEAERKLAESKVRLTEGHEQLKAGDAKAKTLHEQTFQLKRETQEADMSIALLESQLASLRSSLRGVEDLKENQMTILQARREQQNRLLHEKADITELLQASKLELQQIKEQATIMKDGLVNTQESIDEMREVLAEHKEIVKQERLHPSPGIARQAMPNVSPIGVAKSSPSSAGLTPQAASTAATTAKAAAAVAAFSFGDDEAYNIDDIALPALGAAPLTSRTERAASSAAPVTVHTDPLPSVAAPPAQPTPPAMVPPPRPPKPTSPLAMIDPFAGIPNQNTNLPSPPAPVPAPPAPAPAPPAPAPVHTAHPEWDADPFAAAPPAAAPAASAPAPIAVSTASPSSVFDDDTDDWSSVPKPNELGEVVSPFDAIQTAVQVPLPDTSTSPPVVSAAVAVAAAPVEVAATAPTTVETKAPVQADQPMQIEESSSEEEEEEESADEFDDPFGGVSAPIAVAGASAPSTLHVDSTFADSSAPSLASPPPPAVPTFPSALAGTGIPPEFPSSPATSEAEPANPWADDDGADPFGPPTTTPAAALTGSLSPQAAFGEVDEDPFGQADPFAAAPTHTSADAFGDITQPASSIDDFADFGSPGAAAATSIPAPVAASAAPEPVAAAAATPSVTAVDATPAPAAASVPLKEQDKATVASAFDAAMNEDWAAFD